MRTHMPALSSLLVVTALTAPASAVGERTVHRAPPTTGVTSGTGAAPVLVPAATRYRDTSKKAGTGRSGSASITARALRGKAGTTELEVTTGALDGGAAPGKLTKIQLKAFAADGSTAYTRNSKPSGEDGHEKLLLDDVARGQKLQVQTNVTGIDPNRTDVVTVDEVVKLRPDLSVEQLRLAARALVLTGVEVSAVVRELNGDVGATGTCVLYVDGAAVDSAPGIWVDRASAVTCAFTHTFEKVGSYKVEVAVEGGVPSDWDTANQRVAGSVQIVDPTQPMNYWASVSDVDQEHWYRYEGSYRSADGTYPSAHDWADEYSQKGWQQSVSATGYRNVAVGFPLKELSARVTSGEQTLDAVTLTDVGSDWTWRYESGEYSYRHDCAYRYSASQASYLYACSYDYRYGSAKHASTYVSYGYWAGDVTYYSSGYRSYWAWGSGGTSYSWNYSGRSARGTRQTLSGAVSISLRLADEAATYQASPTVTLSAFDYSSQQPRTCQEYSYSTTSYRWCQAWRSSYQGRQGHAQKWDL